MKAKAKCKSAWQVPDAIEALLKGLLVRGADVGNAEIRTETRDGEVYIEVEVFE